MRTASTRDRSAPGGEPGDASGPRLMPVDGLASLPYALAFAAGAMLYVVAEELMPDAPRAGDSDVVTLGVIVGFAVMMARDNIAG